MVSGNPAYYAALDAYEGPTKDDLIRWLKTDPRIEKLGYSVLWTSYKFGHFSDSFYHELTRDIIVNWTNLYVRCSAVQVLYNLEGGDTELEKIKKDHDLPGGLLAVINGTMSRDHLAIRWRGTAPLWEKKKGSADDPSR